MQKIVFSIAFVIFTEVILVHGLKCYFCDATIFGNFSLEDRPNSCTHNDTIEARCPFKDGYCFAMLGEIVVGKNGGVIGHIVTRGCLEATRHLHLCTDFEQQLKEDNIGGNCVHCNTDLCNSASGIPLSVLKPTQAKPLVVSVSSPAKAVPTCNSPTVNPLLLLILVMFLICTVVFV